MAYNPNQPNGRQVQEFGQGRTQQLAVDQALGQTAVDRSGGVDPSTDPQTRVLGSTNPGVSTTQGTVQGTVQQTNPGATGQIASGGYQPTVLGSGAKTDQWSGKGSVTNRGDFGRLEGFDANNFGDDQMQTLKYQAGRIFSRHNPEDPNVLQSILNDPEFKALYPNAKGMGPDKIDFGDGRPVDVIRGHGAAGSRFSWQTEDMQGGGGNGAVSGGNAMMGGGSQPSALALQLAQQNSGQSTDTLAMIMKILSQNKLFDPNENFMLRKA